MWVKGQGTIWKIYPQVHKIMYLKYKYMYTKIILQKMRTRLNLIYDRLTGRPTTRVPSDGKKVKDVFRRPSACVGG